MLPIPWGPVWKLKKKSLILQFSKTSPFEGYTNLTHGPPRTKSISFIAIGMGGSMSAVTIMLSLFDKSCICPGLLRRVAATKTVLIFMKLHTNYCSNRLLTAKSEIVLVKIYFISCCFPDYRIIKYITVFR